jgi:hypothetical protein
MWLPEINPGYVAAAHIKLDEVLTFQLRFTPKMDYLFYKHPDRFYQHPDELELLLCHSS